MKFFDRRWLRDPAPVELPQYVCLCGMVYEHPMQRTACMSQHEAEEAIREEEAAREQAADEERHFDRLNREIREQA